MRVKSERPVQEKGKRWTRDSLLFQSEGQRTIFLAGVKHEGHGREREREGWTNKTVGMNLHCSFSFLYIMCFTRSDLLDLFYFYNKTTGKKSKVFCSRQRFVGYDVLSLCLSVLFTLDWWADGDKKNKSLFPADSLLSFILDLDFTLFLRRGCVLRPVVCFTSFSQYLPSKGKTGEFLILLRSLMTSLLNASWKDMQSFWWEGKKDFLLLKWCLCDLQWIRK